MYSSHKRVEIYSPGEFTLLSPITVTTTADVLAGSSSSRRVLYIQPIGGDIYIGSGNSVTTSNGLLITDGTLLAMETRDAVHAITGSGSVSVRLAYTHRD